MLAILLAASTLVIPASHARPAVEEASFRATVLQVHDEERRLVGSAPMSWDEGLERDAQSWADELARRSIFEHCEDMGCPTGAQGENLWMGTKGAFGLRTMLKGWWEEKLLLRKMKTWEDDYEAVGHYTQMVWSGTLRVGCAVASNRTDDFLVCRYMEAGNVEGESPFTKASGVGGNGVRKIGASAPIASDRDDPSSIADAPQEQRSDAPQQMDDVDADDADDRGADQQSPSVPSASPVGRRTVITTTTVNGVTTTTVTHDDGSSPD